MTVKTDNQQLFIWLSGACFSSTLKTNGERIVKDADMAEEIDVKKGKPSKY